MKNSNVQGRIQDLLLGVCSWIGVADTRLPREQHEGSDGHAAPENILKLCLKRSKREKHVRSLLDTQVIRTYWDLSRSVFAKVHLIMIEHCDYDFVRYTSTLTYLLTYYSDSKCDLHDCRLE